MSESELLDSSEALECTAIDDFGFGLAESHRAVNRIGDSLVVVFSRRHQVAKSYWTRSSLARAEPTRWIL